jgi:hypothetical protein
MTGYRPPGDTLRKEAAMKLKYDEMSELFEERARAGDPGFAIAYALMEVYRAIDTLGCNSRNMAGLGPGVMERVGMKVEALAQAVDSGLNSIADKIEERR